MSIDLSMAYFVPDGLALGALVDAVKRGVKLRIAMPGPDTDVPLVRRASRALWDPILQAGAEIYEGLGTLCRLFRSIAVTLAAPGGKQ